MGLSPDLISQFTELTNNREKTKKETTVYGEIVGNGGKNYVRLDGSELLTPIITTVEVKPGDRVTVLLKNHTATVTGNITSPAAQTETVNVVVKDIENVSSHISNSDIHVTSEEKAAWNAKANQSDIPTKTSDLTNDSGFVDSEDLSSHTSNSDIHVTSEEKAAWNAVNYSNPNQLINPDFKINQRGMTEYTSPGDTVDRWWINNNTTTLTKLDNGIKLSGTGGMIRQIIENPERLAGKTVTASIFLDTIVGSAVLRLRVNGSFNGYLSIINKAGLAFATFTLPEELTSLYFELGMTGSDYREYTISNSKLELGSIATPFVPPDFATELLRIQAMDGTIPSDTIDGKHANEFMQFLGDLTTGSLLDYVLTMTNSGYLLVRSGVTDTPVSGQFFFVDVRRHTGGDYAITATRFNAGGVWTNRYNAGMAKWYGWANVADGGNADTVDGKHANEFMQFLGDIRNGSLLDYISSLDKSGFLYCGSENCTDMPVDGSYFMVGVRCYATVKEVIATSFSTGVVYTNRYSSSKWYGWKNVADGGNAASVGVYTEAKLAELEARLDLLDGDHIIG